MDSNKRIFEFLDSKILNIGIYGNRCTYFHLEQSYINILKVKITIGSESLLPGAAHYIEHLKFWLNDKNLYDAMNKYGAILNANTTEKDTNFIVYFDNKYNQEIINIIIQYLNTHYYEPKIFEHEKKVIINEIEGYRTLFQNDKKKYDYVQSILGKIEEVNSLEKTYLEQTSKKYYNSANTNMYIVGNLTDDFLSKEFKDTDDYFQSNNIKIPELSNIEIFLILMFYKYKYNISFNVSGDIIEHDPLNFKAYVTPTELKKFENYITKYILDLTENINDILNFIETWQIKKGDFVEIYNLLNDQITITKVIKEGISCQKESG